MAHQLQVAHYLTAIQTASRLMVIKTTMGTINNSQLTPTPITILILQTTLKGLKTCTSPLHQPNKPQPENRQQQGLQQQYSRGQFKSFQPQKSQQHIKTHSSDRLKWLITVAQASQWEIWNR
jgi:hypothetical protein